MISVVSDILGEKVELFIRGRKIDLSLEEATEICDALAYTIEEIERAVNEPQLIYDHLSRAH